VEQMLGHLALQLHPDKPLCLKPKAGLIFSASISITGKPLELPPTPIATAPSFYSTDYIGLINH
jgi:hypothetical protein